MKIINKIVNKVTQKRLLQIENFKKYPFEIQEKLLYDIVNKAQNTVFGKEHRFSDILSNFNINSFQNFIPVRDYTEIKPYIDRIRNGENNILWPSPIKWFAVSSGTTSDKSKFIPVSKETLEENHFRGGKDIIVIYSNQYKDAKLVKSKSLVIGGSQQISSFENNLYYGDLSAVIIDNLPIWSHLLRTPSKDVALLPEWEEKMEKMIEQTINENVTSITGVPSWTLVLLKRILKKTGKKNIAEVWPEFELFIHGGVSFDPYKAVFEKILPADTRYLETYNASEGFFALQDDLKSDDLLLMLDIGIFYEFIPFENIHDENPKVYTVNDVQKGINYAMVITTNSGLWRYLIGDTVRFTSLKPHKIKITGRIRHFINAFGEELIIENAEKALKETTKKTQSQIREFTAAPIYISDNSTGAHEWLIEFSKMPENMTEFAEIMDAELKKVNSDYSAKRYNDLTLRMPVIHIAKKDLFYEWLKQKGKLGGQNKVPRLANSRIYIDELLRMNSKK